jgi:hypothetical protein
MLAEEHIERHYHIDPKIFQPRAHYLLKVKGMSMKDIGILDGIWWRCIARRRCGIGRSWWRGWRMR